MEAYFIVMSFMAAAWAIKVGMRELAAARSRTALRDRLRTGAPRIADSTVVTVTGTVRPCAPDALLEAPLSGRKVVYHRSVARMRLIERTATAIEMVPFELETAEGIVRIEGDAADVALPPMPVIPRDPARVRRFLTAYGVDAAHALTASTDEIAIEPGARISVHGLARVEADLASTDERGYREGAPTRVTLEAHPAHPLTLGPP